MFSFNRTTENQLNELFNNASPFKLIILWGEKGNGKTYAADHVLKRNHIKTKNIIFSEENIVSFELLENSTPVQDEDAVLIECSKLFQEDYCLFFQNMEFCDLDSQRIFFRLFKYHKNNEQKATIILEYNVLEKPDNMLCSLSGNILFVGDTSRQRFYEYYEAYFIHTVANKDLFEKILKVSDGNIQNFLTTLNILQYMEVLYRMVDGRFVCNENSTYKVPSNLLELYIDLFDQLKDYVRKPLISAAPISEQIYSTIIRGIYLNYDKFDEYLELLSKKRCFIRRNCTDINKNSQFFESQYSFSDKYARRAILEQTDTETEKQIGLKYYNHLDGLYSNKCIYNTLQNNDKILLLSKLVKKRQNTLGINQIYYIAELMEYFFDKFMYLNVIKQGDNLLESHILNNQQINDLSHRFWIVFFKALLAVGEYEKIIGYRDQFSDEDLNYYIAVALYNYGCPEDALDLLKTKLYETSEYKGYIYSLEASIYDWFGNNKKSLASFKKALKYADHDKLKYQLYKKYSMYIDFRIPECQNKMKSAIDYYEICNLKQYAECLHNYGTGFVMIRKFAEAEKYLNASVDTLNKLCANEIYYPLNSLAIRYCYDDQNYETAIAILKRALKCDIDIAFCELAIHNNIFIIGVNSGDINLAKAERNILETLFKRECTILKNIPKERPDIQHQLRQFYYNCALLCKLEKDDESALKYFLSARECSKYHSVVLYSIEKNIVDLCLKMDKKRILRKILPYKTPTPTELEQFIYENNLYLCEIMFWG